jgi:hypothetical protein
MRFHIDISQLKKKREVRDSIAERFPLGTKVVLLSSIPKVGMRGTVVTEFEAAKHMNYPRGTGEFVAVKLDGAHHGGWYPESLGIIGDLSPAQWPTPKKEPEPRNNDGRQNCYWCGAPTRKFELATSSGRICTACGR